MSNKIKTKISIICQGGGSQTAFTAGVLKVLFDHKVHEKFEIVSLSGTSGGAICAFFIWLALQKQETDISRRLMDFWHDNSAMTPYEVKCNKALIRHLKATYNGHLPSFHLNPAIVMKVVKLCAMGGNLRKEFFDLETLLNKHIGNDQLPTDPNKSPILVVGASNISTGKLEKFSSFRQNIMVKHLLASSCIPSIQPAVEIDGVGYWDGLFADNPPLSALIKHSIVGAERIPDEFWIIKINPTTRDSIPEQSDDIIDRRNELECNNSLFQNLYQIQFFNNLYLKGAFTKKYLKQNGITGPIKIPKLFQDDKERPYHIPFIEMSENLQKELNYESKLDRSPEHIQRLIRDGEVQGVRFLKARGILD